jgi:hypothetical protein
MPKVKNPLFSMEARGGIGGLVFNTWRGVNYVKTNTSPTGQGTAKRLAAQALIFTWSKVWQTIGDVARAAWNQYATDHPVTDWSSKAKRLTGMNWYISCNIQLARLGLAAMVNPPALVAPDPLTGMTLAYLADNITISWTTPATGEYNIELFMVGPISRGISPKIQRASFLRTALPTDFAGVQIVSAAVAGRYTVFARVVCRNTGLVSTWLSAFADAT